ncbi:hypothetical protein DVH24_000339, partial [Malus domestica]
GLDDFIPRLWTLRSGAEPIHARLGYAWVVTDILREFRLLFINSDLTKLTSVSSLFCLLFPIFYSGKSVVPFCVFHRFFLCFDRIVFTLPFLFVFSSPLLCDFLLHRSLFCCQIFALSSQNSLKRDPDFNFIGDLVSGLLRCRTLCWSAFCSHLAIVGIKILRSGKKFKLFVSVFYFFADLEVGTNFFVKLEADHVLPLQIIDKEIILSLGHYAPFASKVFEPDRSQFAESLLRVSDYLTIG